MHLGFILLFCASSTRSSLESACFWLPSCAWLSSENVVRQWTCESPKNAKKPFFQLTLWIQHRSSFKLRRKKKEDWETERERLLSKRNSDECSLKKIPRSRFYICFCYYYIYDLIFQQKFFDSIERMFITHGCVWKEKDKQQFIPGLLIFIITVCTIGDIAKG